ncbi:hypothetical protein STEG23_008088, partial [Scotinomys teguina]
MIISLLNSPLDADSYKYTLEEIIGIAGKPENAFASKKAEQLQDLIFPMASKACPSLKSLDTQIICIR